ncbi:Mo-co oxidoreductase dimerization domain-containing protein [Dunaliella salina]|uniref:Mo-co oxidoreductase dimerization domain-containing protein n=2 Tax=Dunaliella salina TaxID=3046 RepID=A0ABQ7GAK7_DUNSA|nr:Mo-co oxidoreductase dimerization domain-containing protein [Dunaliella salina]|eukprot:KAF5831631.1 Mo-co oxidoreductase dimerization domain-containing protein [Dunaliella salina]
MPAPVETAVPMMVVQPAKSASANGNGVLLANGNGVHPPQNGDVPKPGAVPSFAHTVLGAPYEPPLSPEDPDWALHVPATETDAKDKGTADAWIPRDPRILRLTGRHPLNCEPPMHDLMAAGFITPPSIHYVRNHGPAPRIRWDEHRLQVNGLVERPMTLTMDQIVAMPSVTIPVTMVCAGNRRKEENMHKKSIGFNWGPCAVSTSYWTGVKLSDLLRHVGWWYQPEYIINDLNINSAIARPWHDEVVMLEDGNQPYTVKGYAYAGGGHKIIRCEISLDGGKSWRLANIRRFAEPNDYGKHWCWVHWDIEVPVFDFFVSKEMLLRAWDETQNTQPAVLTWNVMGMMNNCHFRVLLHSFKDQKGEVGVRFQHPAPVEALEAAGITTKEGPLPPIKELAAAPKAAVAPPKPPPGSAKEFTMEEVYGPNIHPAFPQGGKMSQHLDSLKIGDEIMVKGPVGHFTYEGKGKYVNGKNKGVAKHMSMVAGGTGITPILQVLEAVLKDKEDLTCMSLIYANNSFDDILVKDRLDAYAKENPDRFKLWYVLSKPPENWPFTNGYVTEALMRERFFDASPETLGMMCGPPGLLNFVAVPGFEKMGYAKENTVSF